MLAQLSSGTRDLDFDLGLYLHIIFLCASIEDSDKPEPPLLANAMSTNVHELAYLYESVSTLLRVSDLHLPRKGLICYR